jgi:hypothetical protein
VSSKNERLDITMRLLGARQMETEGKKGEKSVEGVGRATRRTSHETSKAAKATGVLTKSYGALGKAVRYGVGFLGVGGVLALQSAVQNTEELSKTTSGLNRNLGLSVETGSEWAAVAQARGIATTALNMSFTKLGKSFVEANRKGGTARTALNQLGITYNQTSRGAHDFNYALDLVGKKFGEAEAGPRRQSAAMSLLGKGYSAVLPLFSQGNKGLQEQLHWAKEYGVTLDGHTNDSIMEMVNAQRENKVAMLGLQLSMTKFLMPAIHAGDDQLQEFIKTLNDPDLSAEQKVARISHQFLEVEDTLFKLGEKLLPHLADQWEEFGIKLSVALWHGFENSDLMGKLVIGGWLLKSLGGIKVIELVSGSIGRKMGGALLRALSNSFANRFPVLTIMMQDAFAGLGAKSGAAFDAGIVIGVAAASVAVGWQIYEHLSEGTKTSIRRWGSDAGEWFVNGMIGVINTGIREINDALDAGNVFSILGVDAPHIGEIGGVNLHGAQRQQNEEAKTHREEGLIDGPGGKPIPAQQFPKGTHPGDVPRHKHPGRAGRAQTHSLPVQHIHLHWNGKEIATGVLQAGEDAAALR